MKILSISHYDMDGFGCQFSIDYKFKNAEITFDNCGYSTITITLNKYDFNDYDLVFITDLNFNGNDLKVFKEKLKTAKNKVIYIDHHQYEEQDLKTFEELKNKIAKNVFKYKIDTNHSATMLTYNLLKIDNKQLFELVKIIDIFDIWQSDKKEFKFSKYLNEFFWKHHDNFFSMMKKANYDYKIYLDEIKKLKNEVELYYKENINKKFFYDKEYKIFLSLDYTFSSFIEDYYDADIAILVGTSDGESGRISVRDKIGARDDIKKYCEKNNISFGGHETAYGLTMEKGIKKVTDDILQIVKDVLDAPF